MGSAPSKEGVVFPLVPGLRWRERRKEERRKREIDAEG